MRASFVPTAFALLIVGALVSADVAEAQRKTVRVDQGAVARWTGDANSCGMDGKTYQAVAGDCWYPIDFARTPGTIEIARWTASGMETAWLVIQERERETQDINFPKEEFVHLSEDNLARLYREQAEIKPLFRRIDGPPRFTLPLGPPADPLPEGKYFAVHRTFNGAPKSRHTGIDYAIGLDNPVLSVADGTVILTGEHFFAGTSVYVSHGNGMVSMYFHLNEIKVEVGQEVKKGDTVGLIGSTGRSTGPHLHLGIRWLNARVDPHQLMSDPSQAPTVE